MQHAKAWERAVYHMVKDYSNLDYGTRPSTSVLTDVGVTINPELLVKDYAVAYLREAKRRNPGKFPPDVTYHGVIHPLNEEGDDESKREQVMPTGESSGALRITSGLDLTVEELYDYFKGILKIRVDSITDSGSKDWRPAKRLWIPDFLEFAISQVGIVVDHTRGWRFIPTFEEKYDMSKLLATSNKIHSLINDGLHASQDAFPRRREGDPDVMGFVIIEGYIQGQNVTQHPIASYVAAFLGLKLKEESTYKLLYRVRYDDLRFIREMLLFDDRLFE